jgi:hypothetical protein
MTAPLVLTSVAFSRPDGRDRSSVSAFIDVYRDGDCAAGLNAIAKDGIIRKDYFYRLMKLTAAVARKDNRHRATFRTSAGEIESACHSSTFKSASSCNFATHFKLLVSLY